MPDSTQLWVLGRLLYWSMPALLAFAAVAGLLLLRSLGFRPFAWARRHVAVLVAALALTTATVWAVPAEERVQWDETNLLSTSRTMHERRVAFLATQTVAVAGELRPLEFMVDKRPPLFPFLVSVVHDVRGFGLENAFVLDAIVWFLLLATAGAAAQARCPSSAGHGAAIGVAAAALLASVPIAVAGARSGGFELLAALLLLVVVLAALACLRDPTRPRFVWLCAAAAMLSNARYESPLVMLVVLVPTLWLSRRHWVQDRRAWLALGALAAFLVPVGWQFVHAQDPDFYSEATAGAALVSAGHARRHLPGLAIGMFDPSPASPFAGPLAWIAVAAAVVAIARRRWTRAWTLLLLPVLATTVAGLAWFYGDPAEPSAQRFYLPLALLLAAGPIALHDVAPRVMRVPLLLLVAGVAVAWRLPEVAAGRAFPRLRAASTAQAIESLLPQLAERRGGALVVTTVAQFLAVRGFGAVSPDGFDRHAGTLRDLRRQGVIRDVFFLTTPLDDLQAARFGSVKTMMQRVRVTEVARTPAGPPVVLWRMGS